MSMPWRNIVAAAALLAFGVCYVVLATALPERPMTGTPGLSFFPLLIGVCVIALSVALLFQGVVGLRATQRNRGSTGWTLSPQALQTLGCFAIYLALLSHAGFILASGLLFAVLMRLFGARSYVLTAIAALTVPIVIYVIFRYGFKIVLPRGLIAF